MAAPTTPIGPKKGGIMIAAAETNPTGFDPHKVTALASQAVTEQTYDSLLELDPNLKVVPRLAKSYETPDDKTYIFHLEENVKFSDGTDLTADDVKFSLDRIMDPKTASPRAAGFTNVDKVEVVDKYTVKLTTKVPHAPMINILASAWNQIVSRKFVESKGGNIDQVTMGSGPYKVAEYIPDQLIRLERNPYYWRKDRPLIDSHVWKVIPDDQARVAALRAKDVEVAWFTDAKAAELFKGNPDFAVYEVPVLSHAVTWINCSKPPLNNVKVRQAMSYALNRQEFLDTVAFGKGVLTGPIPAPEKEWALPVSEYAMYKQDLAKAKALLAEAGFPNGLSITLKVSPQYVLDTGNAQVLQRQLKAVGIDLKIESVEWGNLLSAWSKSDFEMLNLLMLGQSDPDGYVWGRFHSKSPAGYAKLSDPDLDILLDKQRTTVNRTERKKILDDTQRKIVELTPMLYYYCYYVWGVFRPYIKGVTPMANSSGGYLMHEWLNK
jgi:peptide/nickel transport system substrate-binding protein